MNELNKIFRINIFNLRNEKTLHRIINSFVKKKKNLFGCKLELQKFGKNS